MTKIQRNPHMTQQHGPQNLGVSKYMQSSLKESPQIQFLFIIYSLELIFQSNNVHITLSHHLLIINLASSKYICFLFFLIVFPDKCNPFFKRSELCYTKNTQTIETHAINSKYNMW
jgi:hypothetical protein